jgi:hypothetical protein
MGVSIKNSIIIEIMKKLNIKRFGLNKISGRGTPVGPLEVSPMAEPKKEEFLITI